MWSVKEAFFGPCQTFIMGPFAKIVDGLSKGFIIDDGQVPKYVLHNVNNEKIEIDEVWVIMLSEMFFLR